MRHTYYMTNRPPSPGAQPSNGLVNVVDYGDRIKTPNGRMAWGEVEYSRKLTEDELASYEMVAAESDSRHSKSPVSLNAVELVNAKEEKVLEATSLLKNVCHTCSDMSSLSDVLQSQVRDEDPIEEVMQTIDSIKWHINRFNANVAKFEVLNSNIEMLDDLFDLAAFASF